MKSILQLSTKKHLNYSSTTEKLGFKFLTLHIILDIMVSRQEEIQKKIMQHAKIKNM